MKRSSQIKGYICCLMLLGFALVSLMAGCAKQISNESMRHTDGQIAPGHGRLVFTKILNIGDEQTIGTAGSILLALITPPQSQPRVEPAGLTYNLFEVVEKTFVPLAEFSQPSLGYVQKGEIFYVDLPVGHHRFLIVRSKVDFFIRHLLDGDTVFDIDVREGQTTPIFFGLAPFNRKYKHRFLSIRPYPLNDEDVAFIYNLREMNTSDVDREAQVDEKVYEYFTDPQVGIKLNIALKALALMRPATPSDDFKKWATEKQADLATDYAEADLSQEDKGPYDVYKNANRKK